MFWGEIDMKKHSQETDKVEGTQNMTSNSMSRPDICICGHLKKFHIHNINEECDYQIDFKRPLPTMCGCEGYSPFIHNPTNAEVISSKPLADTSSNDTETPYANDLIEMEIKKAKKQAYAEIFKELENGLYRIRSGREIFLTDFAHYNNIKKKYMGGKN